MPPPYYQTKYNTEYDTKCETTYLKNCFPVPRKVPDRECRTEYDQVCTQNTQTITKTRTDTQCKDIVKRVSRSCIITIIQGDPSRR